MEDQKRSYNPKYIAPTGPLLLLKNGISLTTSKHLHLSIPFTRPYTHLCLPTHRQHTPLPAHKPPQVHHSLPTTTHLQSQLQLRLAANKEYTLHRSTRASRALRDGSSVFASFIARAPTVRRRASAHCACVRPLCVRASVDEAHTHAWHKTLRQ